MAAAVSGLSGGLRTNLVALQRADEDVGTVRERLATGRRIGGALDGPNAFFAARNLSQRAGDLAALKEAMGQAISTLRAGDQGVSAIGKLIEQARGLTTTAYANLGLDAASVATRKSLAAQFDAIKAQIDRIAGDSGYAGKNLLAGSGLRYAADPEALEGARAIAGITDARVTNVAAADTFSLRVEGSGAVSGNAADIAEAEDRRGLVGLRVFGDLSATDGNLSDITIELRGQTGEERTLVITEGGESRTVKVFGRPQIETQVITSTSTTTVTNQTTTTTTIPVEGTVAVIGDLKSRNIKTGDTYSITIDGYTFSYTAKKADVQGFSPDERRQNVAVKLRDMADATLTPLGYTIGAVEEAAFSVTGLPTTTTVTDTVTNTQTITTTSKLFIQGKATTAPTEDVSVTFGSGTVLTFAVDRALLEALGTRSNGVSRIEKAVDLAVSATNLAGVTQTRSALSDLGDGKLVAGENALAFDTGTVRFTVDPKLLRRAAAESAAANLTTALRSVASRANDLSVGLNGTGTNRIELAAVDLTSGGQGLRMDFAQNGFMDRTDVDRAVASLDRAKSAVRAAGQALNTTLQLLQTREDFTRDFASILVEGADRLVAGDQDEDGVRLASLQTRQQLASTGLALADRANKALLLLFR